MKTIAFIGKEDPNCYPYNWLRDAESLGYAAQLNTLQGLGRGDVIIIDKRNTIDISGSPAKKILFFPDLIETKSFTNPYLRSRTELLCHMHTMVDIIAMPPNLESMEMAAYLTGKPIFPFMFGVYTQYFDYVPKRFPRKHTEIGYCWSPGSHHRDSIAKNLRAKKQSGFGKDMIDALAGCRFSLNAHYTPLPNNEQRLAEIPLACSVPVSEPLSAPELLSDLHWIPISEYRVQMHSRKEYMSIIRHNFHAVRNKYNSKESLRQLLSYLQS